jgi:glycosyltransferase involved in cell wall biosynthesis
MFICPEEITDLPGIGFVEGMACGCLYFGKLSAIYTDLGLIDGENYVAYDGTIEDLLLKIKFYKKNLEQSTRIAENGKNFVINKFNQENIRRTFYNDLLRLQNSISTSKDYNNIEFESSFIEKTEKIY